MLTKDERIATAIDADGEQRLDDALMREEALLLDLLKRNASLAQLERAAKEAVEGPLRETVNAVVNAQLKLLDTPTPTNRQHLQHEALLVLAGHATEPFLRKFLGETPEQTKDIVRRWFLI